MDHKTSCSQAVKGNDQELVKLISMRVEQAFQRWEADKIGKPDYALESAGENVAERSCARHL